MGLWWPPAATYMRPGASPVPQVRFHGSRGGVFIGHRPPGTPVTPCIIISIVIIRKGEERRKKKRSFTSIQMLHTHTHTRPEPGQPWKARGRKKRTQTTGQRPKQRRGGKGTGGPPEPTYTAKRTWQKTGHTSKPHNTLRRSREGRVIRDQMGD